MDNNEAPRSLFLPHFAKPRAADLLPAGSIEIPCPLCRLSHEYPLAELQPWPPEDGETRRLMCTNQQYLAEQIARRNPIAVQREHWHKSSKYFHVRFGRGTNPA